MLDFALTRVAAAPERRRPRAHEVSDRGVDFIARREGFRATPYQDIAGTWTIGFGHTKGVGPGTGAITKGAARELLRRDLDAAEGAVRATGAHLDQREFDAATSFAYNVGGGALSVQTEIGRDLRAGRLAQVADDLLEWDKAGGATVAGLTDRREAERAMFLGR